MRSFAQRVNEHDLAEIVEPILKKHKVTLEELGGRRRARHLTRARAAFACVMRAPPYEWTLEAIGSLLGRDHSTIRYLVEVGQARQ
jgi:chromosomal replication initiation ATPase DnaA